MPNRVIRAGLLDSDAFLGLPDHDCRLAFIACILTADDLGNFPASEPRLLRLWRWIGCETLQRTAEIATALAAQDLIRWYVSTHKRFGHIPNFRQRLRTVKSSFPRPPADIECPLINELMRNMSDTRRTNGGLIESNLNSKAVRMHQRDSKGPVDNFVKNSDTPGNGSVKKSDTAPRTQLDRARRLGELLGLQRDPLDTDASFVDRVQAELDKRAVRLGTER